MKFNIDIYFFFFFNEWDKYIKQIINQLLFKLYMLRVTFFIIIFIIILFFL